MNRLFWLFLILLFCLYFYLYYQALSGNNLYFTIDQGNDALYVREIWQNKALLLKGPETSIRGIFAGPLWYYFLAPGYVLALGHPIGAVYTMIILNAVLLSLIILWIKRKAGPMQGLAVGYTLLFFWLFFETSLYSFNPFPTITTSFVRIILLIEFLEGKKKYYYWAVLVTLLTFNFDVAIAVVLTLFTYSVGLWGVKLKFLSLKEYAISSFTLPSIAIIFLAKQFFEVFWQTKIVTQQNSGLGVFTGLNVYQMSIEFVKMIGSIIPQFSYLGFGIFIVTGVLYMRQHNRNKYVKKFVVLIGVLTIISFLFFASNKGWRPWHTVYLPPLLLITFLLMLFQLPKKIAVPIFTIVLFSNIFFFQTMFKNYKKPSNDPSLLYNELSAIDWVYSQSENQGFKVYNYTDRFFDDPYQYLFWWYGLQKYGYLPDEYANFPLAPKELYVPGYRSYLEPKRGSDRISFLIVQSDTNGETNKDWITVFRENNNLQEETKIGGITVEKYYRKNGAPSDFCLWWKRCD